VAEYRSSEGKAVTLPYRGPVRGTITDILGGLRSSCTYVGASNLKELPKRTTFIRVSQQINEVFGSKDESKPSFFANVNTAVAFVAAVAEVEIGVKRTREE